MDDLLGAGLLRGGAEGFIRGLQDAEDKKFKQMEFDAKMGADREQKDRQRMLDEANKKNVEFDNKAKILSTGRKLPTLAEGQSIADADISNLPIDREYLTAKVESDPMARAIKGLQYKKEQDEAAQRGKGFKLPPDKVLSVQQGAQIPKQLDNIEVTLKNNEAIFGPAMGRVGGANAYDTQAQTVDAQLRSASQSFGRLMEGGVLRKEDEEKYRKMFPQLSDTPEVAKNKLAIVRNLLVSKQNGDIDALGAQGYDVTGFQRIPDAQLPKALGGGGLPAPVAASSGGLLSNAGGLLKGFIGGRDKAPANDIAAKKARLEELKRKAAGD